MEKAMNNARGNKNYHMWEDHAVYINLCNIFVKLFIFAGIQDFKTGLFYISNDVSFIQ